MSIRLGPSRKRAISLQSLEEAGRQISDTAPDYVSNVDWDRLARELRFTYLEQRVFEAYFRKGIPPDGLARSLGITPKAAESAFDSVTEKLASPRARTCIRIEPQLLPDYYLEIMRTEKLNLLCFEQDRRQIQKYKRFCPRKVGGSSLKLTELTESLATEWAKLARLTEKFERARVAQRDAASAVEDIEAATAEERTMAALEERDLSGDVEKKLSHARAKATAAEATLTAARAALARQSGIVQGIQAELEFRQHEPFVQGIAARRDKWNKMLSAFIEVSQEYASWITANGGGQFDEIFPPSREDRNADLPDRRQIAAIFADALKLGQSRYGYEGEDATPYFKRKVS